MAAEIPAGGRPGLVDIAAPPDNPVRAGLILFQVPARGIGKEVPAFFFQAAFPEVYELVGLALPDKDEWKPAAAFATADAGAGR